MIYEVAELRIDPAKRAEFEKAIEHGLRTVVATSKGYLGSDVKRCMESPARYVLTIRWQTLENHTKDFRESALFTQWRSIVGPFFAEPPFVEHFEDIAG